MQRQGVITVHRASPYENINAQTAEWLLHLKSMWPSWKNSRVFTSTLFNFFSSSSEPFKSVLCITVCCGDFYSGKHNSLAHSIMIAFSKWVQRQSVGEIPTALKLDAVNLMTKQRNSDLLKLVIDVFKVKEDKEIFIKHINELVEKKKFKEACQLATYINLHEYFGIKDFLVPLIYQDKYCVADLFLKGSKKHQVELALFLDNVIGKTNVVQESLSVIEELNITDAKYMSMKYKPLSKLLTKLVKTYDLPPHMCPNMNRKKGKGIVQFLIHKRFIENSISDESWAEMVQEAIGEDEALHLGLVENLAFCRQLKEALTWAQRLGVSKESWPRRLIAYSQSGDDKNNSLQSSEKEETWDDFSEVCSEVNYYKLPLDESQIKVIDTEAKFNEFLTEISNGVSVVGIDAEWKPSFGFKQNDLALIQVAAFHMIYILDIMTLVSAAPLPLWERFASFLFDNPNVLKVGFDIRTDLHLLKDTFRKLHCLKTGSDGGFLDLAVLWQTLTSNYKFVFPFASNSNTSKNLNHLIEICLGETLNKLDQFSNWENRPLRKSQILYAAIDAYCLLEAYDVIVKKAKSQNIPISDVIQEIMYNRSTQKHTTKKERRNQGSGPSRGK